MKSSKLIASMLTIAAAATTFFAIPALGLGDAEAKSIKCHARATAQPGVRIWTCSKIRI